MLELRVFKTMLFEYRYYSFLNIYYTSLFVLLNTFVRDGDNFFKADLLLVSSHNHLNIVFKVFVLNAEVFKSLSIVRNNLISKQKVKTRIRELTLD